jgi:hypothetical protein
MPRLPLLAPLGAVLFTLTWAVLGAVSPGYRLFDLVIEPYSPVSQPVSGLGLGITAPYMNTAFIVCGLLVIAGAIGVRRSLPPTRLATAGVVASAFMGLGMVIDGIFTLESVLMHLLGFLIAVPGTAIGFLLTGWVIRTSAPRLAVVMFVAGPLTLGLFAWFMAIFDPYSAGGNAGYAGLVQRAAITVVAAAWTILGITAWRRLRAPRQGVRPSPAPGAGR